MCIRDRAYSSGELQRETEAKSHRKTTMLGIRSRRVGRHYLMAALLTFEESTKAIVPFPSSGTQARQCPRRPVELLPAKVLLVLDFRMTRIAQRRWQPAKAQSRQNSAPSQA